MVCSFDSPLAEKPYLTPADIRSEDFVIFKPEYGRLFYRDFMDPLREDGVRPRVAKSVSSFDELVFSVSMGEGIALVSTSVVNSEQVAIVPLRESGVHSTYVCLAGQRLPSACRAPCCCPVVLLASTQQIISISLRVLL